MDADTFQLGNMEELSGAVEPGKEGVREEAEGLLDSAPSKGEKGESDLKASGSAHR